jgi:hypothetical protein
MMPPEPEICGRTGRRVLARAALRNKNFDFKLRFPSHVSKIEQTPVANRFKQLCKSCVVAYHGGRMSPHQINELQKKAENYLERAGQAADPQDQRVWLGLARECLKLVSEAREPSGFAARLGRTG